GGGEGGGGGGGVGGPVDRRGGASLCAILTARHLDDAFDLVRAVGAQHAGLHVIAESAGLALALVAAGVPPAIAASDEIARGLARPDGRRASFGGVWLGRRGIAPQARGPRARLAQGRRRGVAAGGWGCGRWRRATCGCSSRRPTRPIVSRSPPARASCSSACSRGRSARARRGSPRPLRGSGGSARCAAAPAARNRPSRCSRTT